MRRQACVTKSPDIDKIAEIPYVHQSYVSTPNICLKQDIIADFRYFINFLGGVELYVILLQ